MTSTLVQLEPWHGGDLMTLHGLGQGLEGSILTDVGQLDAPVAGLRAQTANRPGSYFAGLTRDPIIFPLTVAIARHFQGGASPDDVEVLETLYRKAWSCSRDSKLYAETPNSRRWLPCRLTKSATMLTKRDPRRSQFVQLEQELVAHEPYWCEDDETDTWTSPGAGVQSGTVTVSNPTDLAMWLRWTISAPGIWTLPDWSFYGSTYFDDAELPADVADLAPISEAREIVMPELNAGVGVDIDSNPFEEQVVRVGQPNFWSLMNGVQFLFPVPPYTPATDLPVSVDGPAGSEVQVTMLRHWSRPWGGQ